MGAAQHSQDTIVSIEGPSSMAGANNKGGTKKNNKPTKPIPAEEEAEEEDINESPVKGKGRGKKSAPAGSSAAVVIKREPGDNSYDEDEDEDEDAMVSSVRAVFAMTSSSPCSPAKKQKKPSRDSTDSTKESNLLTSSSDESQKSRAATDTSESSAMVSYLASSTLMTDLEVDPAFVTKLNTLPVFGNAKQLKARMPPLVFMVNSVRVPMSILQSILLRLLHHVIAKYGFVRNPKKVAMDLATTVGEILPGKALLTITNTNAIYHSLFYRDYLSRRVENTKTTVYNMFLDISNNKSSCWAYLTPALKHYLLVVSFILDYTVQCYLINHLLFIGVVESRISQTKSTDHLP
jgi:hypothetical protein